MDSIELLRVVQSFSEFIIAGQSSLYRVGGHEARRGIIGRLRLWRYALRFRMVFRGNRSDCSTVLFPRMGQGMGQNRKEGQGRVELYSLRPVSVVGRFVEMTPAISGFWQNIYLIFCRASEESCAEIAPLRQRKGLRGTRNREACL